mgnify:FL=1
MNGGMTVVFKALIGALILTANRLFLVLILNFK